MSVARSACPSVTFSFPINSIQEHLDLPSSTCVHPFAMGSRGTLLILRSLGQRSESPRPNMPKLFPTNTSRTPWPTFLKLSPHISSVQQRFWGHWVNGQGHLGQMFQNHFKVFSNNFPKWSSSSYICASYFKLTFPVVQNICDKKALGGIMFYEHFWLTFKFRFTQICWPSKSRLFHKSGVTFVNLQNSDSHKYVYL